jgi:PKD repeat protein
MERKAISLFAICILIAAMLTTISVPIVSAQEPLLSLSIPSTARVVDYDSGVYVVGTTAGELYVIDETGQYTVTSLGWYINDVRINNGFIAVATYDEVIRLELPAGSLTPVESWRRHVDWYVTSVDISADGNYVAYLCYSNVGVLGVDGILIASHSIAGAAIVWWLDATDDMEYIAITAEVGPPEADYWGVNTGVELYRFDGESLQKMWGRVLIYWYETTEVRVSEDKRFVAAATSSGTEMNLMDLATGEVLWSYDASAEQFACDGDDDLNYVIGGTITSPYKYFILRNYGESYEIALEGSLSGAIDDLDSTPDGSYFAFGSDAGEFILLKRTDETFATVLAGTVGICGKVSRIDAIEIGSNSLLVGGDYFINLYAIEPHGPFARFTYSPKRPQAGETVTFDASKSAPGWNGTHEMPIISYAWDFESDGIVDAYGVTVTHVFTAVGTYLVTLNVTDSQGLWDIETCQVKAVTLKQVIEDGVAWLAAQQKPDSSWGYSYAVAETGLAVLKLADHAVDAKYGYGLTSPFDPDYPYRENVETGLNYLFANAYIIDIDVQPAGNPDTNGNGIGIYFVSWEWWWDEDYWGLRTYETSIAMMAIAGSRTPDMVVNVPGSPVDGWTYKDVLQDAVDYLAFSQADHGTSTGGWGYTQCDNGTWLSIWDRSDQSNTGWATFALGYAESPDYKFMCTIPDFVKTELNIWIDWIQNDVDGDMYDGGAGYTDPYGWVNILKTGHLLYMMALVGDTATTPRVQAAVDYLVRWWDHESADPGWRGWAGGTASYHATFNVMKGLVALGIHEIDGIDWQSDFEHVLKEQQLEDGSWPNAYWDGTAERILSTTWALLTLQKVIPIPRLLVYVDIKAGSWPNPINVGSQGVFAVAICGTEDFDVTIIDPTTIKITMEGLEVSVSPIRWSYEDVATPYIGEPGGGHALGGDGYLDLVLHFDTQVVVNTLGLGAYVGQTIPLLITGNLCEELGGKPIRGQDYVCIIAPQRR